MALARKNKPLSIKFKSVKLVVSAARSRTTQGPSETAFFDILVKIYECWINGSSYPEYALLQDRKPFRTIRGLRREKFRTLDMVLDMNFRLVVNLCD